MKTTQYYKTAKSNSRIGYWEECSASTLTAAKQVCGKHVFGVLPLSLAAEAERVMEIPLRLPAELRGKELSEAQVREYGDAPRTYKVEVQI
jgi:hypothetical protein